ncbi:PDZ domain-containing protein 8-like [Gigantopelta aegis]|uniref:PDZ domain-containing protein 8-like n=1 Tax=Gigantopelta aegis TaxID=1735272 RepID=UPI001B8885C5|nr:PDZ domain-containing protein 8-like [Gigantopelta aegis]
MLQFVIALSAKIKDFFGSVSGILDQVQVEVVLCSLLAGVLLTVFLQFLFFKLRFGQLPVLPPPVKNQYPKIKLPQLLKEQATKPNLNVTEKCLWFNLLAQFLFRELRDTQEVRRWVMRKMNNEFQELLSTLSGKLMDQIIVRDFSLGDNFPIVNSVAVTNVLVTDDVMEELDLSLDVDYTGGFQLAVDVYLLFNKSAYLSVTVKKMKGKARMQFTRMPYTHWSFSFYEDPEVDFAVESHFDGRPFPQIASLVISQLRRSIRKKHTLPNFKMRFRPFFWKPESYVPQRELKVRGQNISVGQLRVTVIECSRLITTPKEALLYCTISVDNLPWKELVSTRQRVWKAIDVEVNKGQTQSVGMTFREEHLLDRFEVVVMVDSIISDSPAALADIRKNDILIAVSTAKIFSSKQAAKLIKNSGEKFTIRIDRAQMKISQDVKFSEETVSLKDVETEVDEESKTQDEPDEYIHISFKVEDHDSRPSKSLLDLPSEPRFRSKRSVSEAMTGKLGPMLRRESSDPQIGTSGADIDTRERSESDTCLLTKDDDEGDLVDYGSDSDDDTYNVQKLHEVTASKSPRWNKEVTFEVGEQHRYLNLCVRCKIPEKVDRSDKVLKPPRDLLLGHVTLSLSDVALQCLLTRQSDSQETVPLQPGEMKTSASRTKTNNLASHPGFDSHLCYGDITLAFHFKPMNLSELDKIKLTRHSVDPTVIDTSSKESSHEDASSMKTDHLSPKGLHHFTGTQFHAATYCHFCGKKIWMKVAFQCSNCTMICHKKCVEKCNNDTICTEAGPMKRCNPSEAWQTPVSTKKKGNQDDREGISRTGRLLSKFRKESASAVKMESPKFVKRTGISPSRKTSDQSITPNPSPRPSPQPPRKFPTLIPDPESVLAEAMGPADLNSCESTDEPDMLKMIQDQQEKIKGQNVDELVVTSAKQMGKELFAHLDVEDRKQKLDSMVSKLQQEIDQETENKMELCLAAKTETDLAQRQVLDIKMSKSDEKTEALMMLLLHYCAGLQHCMDLEEEQRQKSDIQRETTAFEEAPSEESILDETGLSNKEEDVGDVCSSDI